MNTALPKPWTVEDFLAWEAQQEEHYEFVDGMVIIIVGAPNVHTMIKAIALPPCISGCAGSRAGRSSMDRRS